MSRPQVFFPAHETRRTAPDLSDEGIGGPCVAVVANRYQNAVLQKIFFAPTSSSQAAGGAFIERLAQRTEDLDTASGPDVAAAQMAAFREWEQSTDARFADLKGILQPTLVVNGIHDEMIPVSNSYRLVENLPNAVLLAYPDSGHGSLFQFHESFTRQAAAFLASDAPFAPY